jgi:hypothetical protein
MELKPEYVMKLVDINKKTTNEFFIYEDERRKIRMGKVAGIRQAFNNPEKLKKHFSAPLVVNKIKNKLNLIDGNHRFSAILEKLEREPEFSITTWVAEYKNLDRASERTIYSMWNSGTSESATDYLQYYWKTIPLANTLLRELPVEVYATPKKLSVKLLVGCHISVKGKKFKGGYGAGGQKTVDDFRNLTMEDIKIIKAWYKDYSEIFGEYMKGNLWYSSTPLNALYKIWYDNRTNIERQKLINAFRDVFQRNINLFIPNMKSGGREATMFFYNVALQSLRNYRKKIIWTGDLVSYLGAVSTKEENSEDTEQEQ